MKHPPRAAPPSPVVGRFAPSPTGRLHFGSLLAALASHCDARSRGGRWLVRIDDLDAARAIPGMDADILRTLEAYGFAWDGEVAYQSRNLAQYEAAFARLREGAWLYPCGCSRKDLTEAPRAIDGSTLYPGTCRHGLPPGKAARAWRFRAEGTVTFDDRIQGRIVEDLPREVGDFVVKRADGVFAYQLAVVIDDALGGVTDVVRGADLLGSTARQIALHRALELPVPRYAHLPVAVDAHGDKLSKQTLARPLEAAEASVRIAQALDFLGHAPPAELRGAPPAELLAWAVAHWDIGKVPAIRQYYHPDTL
ncbi:tRNA glutamyl-Q(34) synthetase GluQRS [Tepidiphilus sp. J10]|uniref:tRNA glutamyl-Q(34) synthetase GluQRS n=1 Tax=Tepidiphilus sp. J10 TaxID=2502185 RepID=UPI00115DCA08|nr:tRNA glutamyl-Q(34) synthetase GluQRS [Tepidiphilus sp. J10]